MTMHRLLAGCRSSPAFVGPALAAHRVHPVAHANVPILLDASRLIWRLWTRRLPTGIDGYASPISNISPRAGGRSCISAITANPEPE